MELWSLIKHTEEVRAVQSLSDGQQLSLLFTGLLCKQGWQWGVWRDYSRGKREVCKKLEISLGESTKKANLA